MGLCVHGAQPHDVNSGCVLKTRHLQRSTHCNAYFTTALITVQSHKYIHFYTLVRMILRYSDTTEQYENVRLSYRIIHVGHIFGSMLIKFQHAFRFNTRTLDRQVEGQKRVCRRTYHLQWNSQAIQAWNDWNRITSAYLLSCNRIYSTFRPYRNFNLGDWLSISSHTWLASATPVMSHFSFGLGTWFLSHSLANQGTEGGYINYVVLCSVKRNHR